MGQNEFIELIDFAGEERIDREESSFGTPVVNGDEEKEGREENPHHVCGDCGVQNDTVIECGSCDTPVCRSCAGGTLFCGECRPASRPRGMTKDGHNVKHLGPLLNEEEDDSPPPDATSMADVTAQEWKEVVEEAIEFLQRNAVTAGETKLPLPLYILFLCALGGMLCTLFFSRPLWCWNKSCGNPRDVLTIGLPVWSNIATLSVQLSCFIVVLCIRAWTLFLKVKDEGSLRIPERRDVILLTLLSFAIIDNIISFALLNIRQYPLAPLAIPFIVAFASKTVVIMLQYLAVTAGRTGAIGATVMGFVLVWSWLGYMVFLDTSQQIYFENYWDTVLDMFVCGTTSNYPDIILPAFYENRASFLYFLPYVVLTLWCLLLLLTIIMYDKFKEEMDKKDEQLEQWRVMQLKHVFAMLNRGDKSRDVVSTSVMVSFLAELRRRRLLHNLKKKDEETLLRWIERGGDHTISSQEFGFFLLLIAPIYIWEPAWGFGICVWLDRQIWHVDSYATGQGQIPGDPVAGQRWAHRITHSRWYEYVVDILIVLSVAVTAAESAAYAKNRDYDDTPYLVCNTFFTYLFVGELILRWTADGFSAFWLDALDRADFFIILSNLIISIISFTNVIDRGVYNLLLAFRILRLLRLALRFDSFVAVIAPFSTVGVSTYCGVFFNIFLILSVFAMVGNLCFGGDLYITNPYLKGTDYAYLNYFAINFNDFTSALVLQVCMLVMNNWDVFMDGTAAATHPVAKLYYVIVVIIGPFLFITTLTSLVFDAYMKGKENVSQLRKSKRLVKKVLGAEEGEDGGELMSWRTLAPFSEDILGNGEGEEQEKAPKAINLGICLKCHMHLEDAWIACPACGKPCEMYF